MKGDIELQPVAVESKTSWLSKIGAEERGVEWVPESERIEPTVWTRFDALTFWFSVNCAATSVPIGLLASVFSLGMRDALLCIFGFNFLGCCLIGLCAIMGPATGLRQMVIARYSFGYWGAVFLSFVNIITQMGFAVVAIIVGGQILAAVFQGLPLTWGIIIISLVTLVLCFFGYKHVHTYMRYAWFLVFIFFCMLWGVAAPYSTATETSVSGSEKITSVLIYGGILFGTCSGWTPVAADYNMAMPATSSKSITFILTFLGNFLGLSFCEVLGVVIGTALTTNDEWNATYADGSNWGGLMNTMFKGKFSGFGVFIMLIMALSTVANNIANTYSAGLSVQALGSLMQKIPRAVWTILVVIIYTIAGVVGQTSFSSILSNLLSILSYWTGFFATVLIEEYFLFRKDGFNSAAYNSPSELPVGLAGLAALIVGVAGAVLGMSQIWYVGAIATQVGGADIGFELAILFAGVVYPIARHFELKRFRR
ncbi:purine-cytosine permease FCY21 [Chytriomyces sp. MP71]|nr:purine-cytosine permease FCY21 [Chytriomyces sp. MP71]